MGFTRVYITEIIFTKGSIFKKTIGGSVMGKHVFVIIIILTAIGGLVFLNRFLNQNMLRDSKNPIALQEVSQPKNPLSHPQENKELTERNKEPLDKSKETEQVLSDVYKVYKAFGEQVADEPISLDEDAKRMLSLMNTPEYEAFLETQPTSLADFYDFFAAHGVPIDKNDLFEEAERKFREHFPGESAEELEPRMRQELIRLLDENGGDQFVLIDFVINEKYDAWGTYYFKTDSEAFVKWGVDVIKEYGSSTTEAPVVDPENTFPLEVGEPSDRSIIDDLPTAASKTTHIPQKSDANPKENMDEVKKDIDATLEAEILRALLNTTRQQTQGHPKTPNFDKVLHRVFPSARVKSALLILNRSAPQKALSELRMKDPEIATYIERFVLMNKEKDK